MFSLSGGKDHLVQLAVELELGEKRKEKENNLKMHVLMAAEQSWCHVCIKKKRKKWGGRG